MRDIDEEGLHGRFRALREYDARYEPEFRPAGYRAESGVLIQTRSRTPARRWIAAAACIVLGAALVIGKARDRRDERSTTAAMSAISEWQSPTAGLLRNTGRELLAPPPFLSSVFDSVAPATLRQKLD